MLADVTPRMAWLLHYGALCLVNQWADLAADPSALTAHLHRLLPPTALPHAEATPGWVGCFLAEIRDISLGESFTRAPARWVSATCALGTPAVPR